jgi:cyclopropane fatty-acyl-phospholipid synthase-like methyltransferase
MAVQDLAPIREYYDQTWRDYRFFWLSPSNYAIHFGYWDANTRHHGEALNQLNLALASRIGIRPGMRILDAGCGVGGSAIWLARTYDVEVVGITPVTSQIDRANRFAREQGLAYKVRFAEEDYTGTSFASGSFDVVWAMESVCHAADKAAFYREARRLLRPGGRLGMVEYLRKARPLPVDGEALLHSWLSGWAIPDLATADEHRAAATANGFGQIVLQDITDNVRPSLARLSRMATATGPAETILWRVGLRSPAQHGNWRGARDQFRALRRGLWFDAILTATAIRADASGVPSDH